MISAPQSASAIRRTYSLSGTGASSAIQFGTCGRRDSLVVGRMRQALAAALAVPVLWMSTVAFPIMGLVYWLAIFALDRIEYVGRGKDP